MRLSVYEIFLMVILANVCPAQAAEFSTTSEINQTSLSAAFYKLAGRFYVDVSVENVSPSPQTIKVWTNAGWSWVTDSKDVVISQEALQNVPSLINLKPGDVYRGRVEMAAGPMAPRPITFRLGFLPDASHPAMDDHEPAIIWSNLISLTY